MDEWHENSHADPDNEADARSVNQTGAA